MRYVPQEQRTAHAARIRKSLAEVDAASMRYRNTATTNALGWLWVSVCGFGVVALGFWLVAL